MRVLLATNHIFGWTGSELTIRTLFQVLRAGGSEVLIYAPFLSSRAHVSRILPGANVAEDLREVHDFAPAMAYTQHHPVAMEVRAALPRVPIVHALLGVLPHLERAPSIEIGVEAFLAISEEVRDAATAGGVDPSKIRIFRNIVDDSIFDCVASPRPLRSIAIYSYKLTENHLRAVEQAAVGLGVTVHDHRPVSPGTTPYDSVPSLLATGEVVVASGRGAIEAMLAGCVPLILADCGDDGLVTPENFDDLMTCNFSGRRRARRMNAVSIIEDLRNYRPEMGVELQKLARAHLSVSGRKFGVLSLFEEVARCQAPDLDEASVRQIRFLADGVAEQRRFAARAREIRDCGTLSASSGERVTSSDALVRQGNEQWRSGKLEDAIATYYEAVKFDVRSTAAARQLAGAALMMLFDRERTQCNLAAQRRALASFLALNPENSWAVNQLQALSKSE